MDSKQICHIDSDGGYYMIKDVSGNEIVRLYDKDYVKATERDDMPSNGWLVNFNREEDNNKNIYAILWLGKSLNYKSKKLEPNDNIYYIPWRDERGEWSSNSRGRLMNIHSKDLYTIRKAELNELPKA